MSDFQLDPRLRQDCIELTSRDNIRILLLNNELVPWFVLVPEVDVKELYELSTDERTHLNALQDEVSVFVLENFDTEKLNVAAIGNVVSQMHIHVIGRKPGDYCWPGVVWGNPQKEPYADDEVNHIHQKLVSHLR